jgi:hypothetical protein
MKANIVLVSVFLFSFQAVAQDAVQPQTRVQCKFSDGTEITVMNSPERRSFRLSTNDALITAGGITVPAGNYTVVPGWERYGYFLILQKATKTRESSELPRIRLSASTLSVAQKKAAVSFVSTGGSCMMQLASEDSSTLLSVEFTKKNTDLPVLQ